MTNRIITPPDLDKNSGGHLVINANHNEVDLIARWMPVSIKDYTVYLYNEDMQNIEWLSSVVDIIDVILISSSTKNISNLTTVLEHGNKIVWFGQGLKYQSPAEYLINHD